MTKQIMIRFALISAILVIVTSGICTHQIYCQGQVLEAIQLAGIFKDSKTFVDMPLKFKPDIVYSNFKQLPDQSQATLTKFIQDNFMEFGAEVKKVTPTDWKPFPGFLTNLKNQRIHDWGSQINAIWLNLVKQFDHSISCGADCFSSILSRYPFVVPGGRFNEYYYWDNLWIVHGLIVSQMYDTALHVVHNLLDNIKTYGFMPNGARIYYLSRTQPPVTAIIVDLIYETLKDVPDYGLKAQQLLLNATPILKTEHEYWTQNRLDEQTNLNFFFSNQTIPRPQSFREDYLLVSGISGLQNPEYVYRMIGAAAESGWDFSSRWFKNGADMRTVATSDVIPVDLNVIMLKLEKLLAKFSFLTGNVVDHFFFMEKQSKRVKNMKEFLYNTYFSDFNLATNSSRNQYYNSNFSPLWELAQFEFTDDQVKNLINEVQIFVSRHKGGLPSSEFNSTQQWDFPNVWPPSQYIVIEGLLALDQAKFPDAHETAKDLAYELMNTAFCAFYQAEVQRGEGVMYEKYNSEKVGQAGGSGEYEVQSGFGWTNGVILRLIQKYGFQYSAPVCDTQHITIEK